MSALPTIRYEKVEAYSIAGIQFACVSKWNGFEEWKDAKGRKLIVHRDRWLGFAGVLADSFGGMFPEMAQGDLVAIACDKHLAEELKLALASATLASVQTKA